MLREGRTSEAEDLMPSGRKIVRWKGHEVDLCFELLFKIRGAVVGM